MRRNGHLPRRLPQHTHPAIPKKDKIKSPLNHRLLAIFSALYRVEAGAWFDHLYPWFVKTLHPKVYGAIPGYEATDVSWEAQLQFELSILQDRATVMASYDYWKFFDLFDYDFTEKLLIQVGIPKQLTTLTHNLYKQHTRTMRSGKALGEPFHPNNGIGQGDVLSLLPALALVSWQFYVVQSKHPGLDMGACVDDRNFRGGLRRSCRQPCHHSRVRPHCWAGPTA